MRPKLLIGLLAVILSSCKHRDKQPVLEKKDTITTQTKADVSYIENKEDTSAIVADTTKKIRGYSAAHSFSDTSNRDNFSITLFGKTMLKGVVVFEITDHNNKSIFKETFYAQDLLSENGYGLNDKQKQDTITNRMAHFFDEQNFSSPAIDAEETFDMAFSSPEGSEKPDWEDIKKDTSTIGFVYSYGYEGLYKIAYSKKLKKVLLVFYSD